MLFSGVFVCFVFYAAAYSYVLLFWHSGFAQCYNTFMFYKHFQNYADSYIAWHVNIPESENAQLLRRLTT